MSEEINEKIEEAIEQGNVSIPHLEDSAVALGTDVDCRFSISETGLEGACMLTLADGGGFTGFVMEFSDWPEIRSKIDAFIEKRKEK